MKDQEIVALYFHRSDQAITETSRKYGAYCRSIAGNILQNDADAEECVNDTYLGAWNSIPPNSPENLATYLGKLTRRISLQRWRANRSLKRGGGETALALDELEECIPSYSTVEKALEQKELAAAINRFVASLEETERAVFLCRYWYIASIDQIAVAFRFSSAKVKSMLYRTRQKLQRYLHEEEQG
ncbi:MAG: RNA polymerase sigma factor [Oscillospiraceae bacterium]